MALKPQRSSTINYNVNFFASAVADRGGIVCATTGTPGSGAARDSANMTVEYAVNPSGRHPIGLLLNDIVNKDLSQTWRNDFRYETQVGDKVPIATKGTFTTNLLSGGTTGIVPGQPAYLAPTGTISAVQAQGTLKIGTFQSRVDEDGYFSVQIDL